MLGFLVQNQLHIVNILYVSVQYFLSVSILNVEEWHAYKSQVSTSSGEKL